MHGQRYIRIVRRPEGEAPEWVRDAWIGTVLPLRVADPVTALSVGVVTGPRTWLGWWWQRLTGQFHRATGYEVIASAAVDILEAQSPAAADWWRDHVAYMLDGQHIFLFDMPACQPVG